jgi:hypothetical protein
MGHHLDGRASLVVGTHTHVPTADHRILAGGTAYMSDAGMCGDYDSVLGMQKEESIRRFLQKTPGPRMEPALGEGSLCGIAVETDDRTGLAVRAAALRLGPPSRGNLAALLGLTLRILRPAVPWRGAVAFPSAPRHGGDRWTSIQRRPVRRKDLSRGERVSPGARAPQCLRRPAGVIDEAKGESITIGQIIEAFGERAFGFVLILFSLPNCVPNVPRHLGPRSARRS